MGVIGMREAKSNKTSEGTDDAEQWLRDHSDATVQLRDIFRQYYEENGRDIPWRRTRDPYKVLVAEILLQKTAYRPVRSVWTQLVERYPDVQTLAGASLDELEPLIRPLGLHRRAQGLLNVAKAILNATGGEILEDADFLTGLPGVGSYMSAAVLSYAFGTKAIAVDVNVARVLTRISGFLPNTHRQALAFARAVGEQLVTQETHRAVNYGLLDLSAQICRPKPHCDTCPASLHCAFDQAAGA